jgi:demethylmenaquinone methyltransferase / 2-methoxy-6-polyprenyl-1,4-benzoquinol methylase
MMFDPKKIEMMFSNIANRYDLANNILSLTAHKRWRKLAVTKSRPAPGEKILDICCGTGDLAIEYAKINDLEIIGIDFSDKMLELAQAKTKKLNLKSFPKWQLMDATRLPFPQESFNIISCGFGIRNIPEFDLAIEKFYTILKPNGRLVILEFSLPKNKMFRILYLGYLKAVLPMLGRLVTRHRQAYRYLADSITKWDRQVNLAAELQKHGFEKIKTTNICGGIAQIIIGYKLPSF